MPVINQVPENPVVVALQQCVEFTYSMLLFTHGLHWNVEGDDFFQLHGFLNDEYTKRLSDADMLAERVRQLASYVKVDMAKYATSAGLPVVMAPFDAETAITTLVGVYDRAINGLKELSVVSQRANDLATQQIALDLELSLEKSRWMLRSYLK